MNKKKEKQIVNLAFILFPLLDEEQNICLLLSELTSQAFLVLAFIYHNKNAHVRVQAPFI